MGKSCSYFYALRFLCLFLFTLLGSFFHYVGAFEPTESHELHTRHQGSVQQECTLQLDGSCVVDNDDIDAHVDGTAGMVTKSTINAYNDYSRSFENLPPIPVPDIDGFVTTGYGERQLIVSSGEQTIKSQQRLEEMHRYMHGTVYTKYEMTSLKDDCWNRHESCTFWASIGECDANPAYMTIQCAPACLSCDHLLYETRCPMPEGGLPALQATDIWREGDLNRMFERIVSDPYYAEVYGKDNINIKSRPSTDPSSSSMDPWVVVIDNFLTDEECDTLIELGAQRGYEISKDVGKKLFDGTYEAKQSTGRTSTNAWCLEECFENQRTQDVLNRIVNLTGIPDINSEYLQLLRYDVGQFYERHHDYIDHHVDRLQGVRILTVFLYLNDVEAGGGTNFPVLDLTVMPKRGRVLLWPSVLDANPNEKDPLTDHQALPVEKGIKYGANAWLHLRDFKTPYHKSCI